MSNPTPDRPKDRGSSPGRVLPSQQAIANARLNGIDAKQTHASKDKWEKAHCKIGRHGVAAAATDPSYLTSMSTSFAFFQFILACSSDNRLTRSFDRWDVEL